MATATKPWWLAWPVTQAYGVNGEQGVDIGTPFHTPITAPYGGQVTRTGCYAYGCEVDVLANVPGLGAVEEYVIHLDQIANGLHAGQAIAPGAALGLSGGETQAQVNAGLFPGAQHPVQNTPSVTYSTGPHSEIGFFRGTPFASADAGNPMPYLQNATGIGGADPCATAYAQCAASCNGDIACTAGCAAQLAGCTPNIAANDISGLGGSIGQGIASGFASLGQNALSALGFTSFKDAVWRTVLVVVGLIVLIIALVMLFRKQEGEAVGLAEKAA